MDWSGLERTGVGGVQVGVGVVYKNKKTRARPEQKNKKHKKKKEKGDHGEFGAPFYSREARGAVRSPAASTDGLQ